MDFSRIAYAAIVGIVVFLLCLLLFPLVGLPTQPWAPLLGLLAGVVTFFRGSFMR